ncbi:hypothetical protein DC345_28935 [Paenibacillus taichungensis]|uniref:DUF3829 domain-containing protein n=1 Tax=Paenibacillus taichungensis TaxID=484184 RepID=A0A329QCH3_9BACL|nr:hypothetical protein [Paenibacillus taichungensis]RAW10095.1 hypothetical protein DC345_28935 [Paenibacillus taichungensis]
MRWNHRIKMFTAIFSLAAILTACGGGAKEATTKESAQDAGTLATATNSSDTSMTDSSAADTNAEGSEVTSSTSDTAGSSPEEGKIGVGSTLEELKQQYADKLGYIRVPLNDHPVRRVSEKGSKNINIANYSDAVVNMNTGIPIHSDSQRLIDDAFPFFTTVQAPEVSYVSWEEATNLERAMVKTLFISRQALLLTEDAMKNKDYTSQSFTDSMEFFKNAAEFDSMAPVAQHTYDITLTKLYDKARDVWGKLAAIDPEQDEAAFAEKYTEARTEANNVMGLLNILLSANEEERLEQTYGK